MPLNTHSPIFLHYLQNILLITLCAIFTPLLTLIAILSTLISPFTTQSQKIQHQRTQRANSPSTFPPPRTILVTGVGMSKGLCIARSFYRAGHNVIAADFEPYYIPSCGHFSRAIRKFYRLRKPCEERGSRVYVRDIVEIVQKERCDLWVSCSGVASAIEDAEAKELVERETSCLVVQFGVEVTGRLHEKYSFVKQMMELGLNVPLTYRVHSVEEALRILYPETGVKVQKQFIMKPEMVDDSVRADMTILPRPTLSQTQTHIQKMNPSIKRPFVLQQYISGREYCTHSIILLGKIHAFTSCQSSDMLMHYRALEPSSALAQAMLHYTTLYLRKTSSTSPPAITGHFSLDFLINEQIAQKASRDLAPSDADIENLQKELFPIECNPRVHTAVILLNDKAEEMADAYIQFLSDSRTNESTSSKENSQTSQKLIIVPSLDAVKIGYYWIGHDILTKMLLPIFECVSFQRSIGSLVGEWMEFFIHLLWWKDGMYEIWDPWPAWCLYVLFLPGCFCACIWEGKWWSRCNVSTGKFFGV
ncbi:27441723-2be8-428f-821c-525678a4d844 [Sclerotinia trifoliorum]|uniref:27441723-2be8-428f-821c-525678a4d844 n=1 Tax=Sclerotinia trifoliorum TaxID=28548 RepID=A0A8H2W1U6_9HELO|nr:27441723-2be8-428f-821c-525678a4d844 [Sclerotinia trifoliorum]